MFFWIIILGAIIWLVIKQINLSENDHKNTSRAQAVLNERFAKGEIDESTYQKMKHYLEEGKK